MKKLTMIMIAILAGASAANAQMQSPDTTARYFLIHASIGNLQEISAGKLAMQQGTTADVRAFGKMMVDDHSNAEAKLLQLAKSQHIMLPSAATDTPVPDLNLKKSQGIKFDHLYVHATVPAHSETVMKFQDYAIGGKNPAVKSFAEQMLPALKQHLMIIKSIDDKMKN